MNARLTLVVGFGLMLLPALVGCPPQEDPAVVARIGTSSTSGPAPLTVTFTGVDSSSRDGTITTYAWDFDDGGATANTVEATHAFADPGRYSVTLTVTDSTAATDTASVDIRVRGGPVVADIDASVLAGQVPLTVFFDGTASTAEEDVILDYFWDFGDDGTSRLPRPVHIFYLPGTFTVTLRAVSAGGVEDTAEATIFVTASNASLQFNGGQLASVPVPGATPYQNFSIEAWLRADPAGGAIVSFGIPAMILEVLPSSNTIRLQQGSDAEETSASVSANVWHHLALTYHETAGATVYLDATVVSTADFTDPVTISSLTIGAGFRGRIAEVSFWSTARTAAQVAADANTHLAGTEAGLAGFWPINEGAGQTLRNLVAGGAGGTLGATAAVEAADPAWSTDGPPP